MNRFIAVHPEYLKGVPVIFQIIEGAVACT